MGISIWQLAIFAIIVVLLFGGKRLRNLGSDLGASLKDFKKEMQDDEQPSITNERTVHSDKEPSIKEANKEDV